MEERERLIEIMNSQGLNAKQLSLKLCVSAGTISNIMNGRNRPSLELLQNLAEHFPFIHSDWLFLGKGEMYKADYEPSTTQGEPDLFSRSPFAVASDNMLEHHAVKGGDTLKVGAADPTGLQFQNTKGMVQRAERSVQKILIFYTDGTFEER